MAVAHFEVKGVSVPTVAEGRWATLLARQVVPPAQAKEELDAKLHDEDKQEEAEQGERSNEGGVDRSRATEETGGDAEDYKRMLEKIALIDTNHEARNVMMNASAVPPNCSEAFTALGDQLFPAPDFRYYSSSKQRAELLKENVDDQIR
ncbi:hypothetical protein HPB52_011905 [Rhipicephalus sanguineus]|uniref:Uncharacterized protein n=1 Tax=Rhipicephalus sanguineus TaxID=34632 RepID=A0A9D4QET8_RHISA|nr:hypothetical protein HPB52_011905 [Rhipicephalus sanguineus]